MAHHYVPPAEGHVYDVLGDRITCKTAGTETGGLSGVVLGAVLVVTLAAAAVPAWRASRIDPLAVLREN